MTLNNPAGKRQGFPAHAPPEGCGERWISAGLWMCSFGCAPSDAPL